MHTPKPLNDPAKARPLTDEADIGSGEKTPGQLDTEKIIADIPALPRNGRNEGAQTGAKPGANVAENKAAPDQAA